MTRIFQSEAILHLRTYMSVRVPDARSAAALPRIDPAGSVIHPRGMEGRKWQETVNRPIQKLRNTAGLSSGGIRL